MFKGNRKYIVFLAICFTALIVLQLLSPKPINWNLSYMKRDKIPYGTSALSSVLPALFPAQQITDKQVPAYNSLKGISEINRNYIFINQSFEPDKLDTRELLRFVEKGNTVFIAVNYLGGKLADTMKLKTDDYFDMKADNKKDSALLANMYKPNDTAKINFVNPHLKSKTDYVFAKGVENTYFISFDTAKTTILGKNSNNKINFIKVKQGKGFIYISTVPETFSNYYFVNQKNYDYAYKALSYLPLQTTLWDEYYKVGNIKKESPLRVIFNNPALLTAYYVLIISLLIFMIIGIKRRQRIIPVLEPMRNTTLDFVDIVGTLYFQTGNHKNIADKKITYFLEHIRTAFQIKTNIYDDMFIERITNLSGIEKQKVHDLFYFFSEISFKQNVTQQELLKLNTMIENFYKASKR